MGWSALGCGRARDACPALQHVVGKVGVERSAFGGLSLSVDLAFAPIWWVKQLADDHSRHHMPGQNKVQPGPSSPLKVNSDSWDLLPVTHEFYGVDGTRSTADVSAKSLFPP